MMGNTLARRFHVHCCMSGYRQISFHIHAFLQKTSKIRRGRRFGTQSVAFGKKGVRYSQFHHSIPIFACLTVFSRPDSNDIFDIEVRANSDAIFETAIPAVWESTYSIDLVMESLYVAGIQCEEIALLYLRDIFESSAISPQITKSL